MAYSRKYYLKNIEEIKRKKKIHYLKNIEEIKRKKKIYYLKNREKIYEQSKEYQSEYRKNHIKDFRKYSNFYANTENGFLHNLWSSLKARCKKHERINEFKNFDEFNNHWLEQKARYGMKCPAMGIEMTFIRKLDNVSFKRCPTNMSADRILSTEGYNNKNLIFTSWGFNYAKGPFTPEMARAFLRIVGERYENK